MNDKQIIILKAFEDELNKLSAKNEVNYLYKRDRPSAGAIGGLMGGAAGYIPGLLGGYLIGSKVHPAAMVAGATLGTIAGGKAGARLFGGKKRKYDPKKLGIVDTK